jgi:hypothetical protein
MLPAPETRQCMCAPALIEVTSAGAAVPMQGASW